MKADLVTPERMLLRWCWWCEGRRGGLAFATASWPTGSPSSPRNRHQQPAGESMDREEVQGEEEEGEKYRYIQDRVGEESVKWEGEKEVDWT